MSRMLTFLVSLIASMLVTPSHAALLGSGNANIGTGASLIGGEMAVNLDLGSLTIGAHLFSGVFQLGSPDQSIIIDSGPLLSDVTAILTNGVDDVFAYNLNSFLAGGTSAGRPESLFFAGSPNVQNGIDFAGSSIEKIELHVINRISSPGSNPNGNGIWTDYYFDVRLDVFGVSPVPEPSSFGLLLTGLTVVSLTQRRRRRV